MLSGVTNISKGSNAFTNSFGKGVKNVAGKLGSGSAISNSESAQTTLKRNTSVSEEGHSHGKDGSNKTDFEEISEALATERDSGQESTVGDSVSLCHY